MDQYKIIHHITRMGETFGEASGFYIDKSIGTLVVTDINNPTFNVLELHSTDLNALLKVTQEIDKSILCFPGKSFPQDQFDDLMEQAQFIKTESVLAQHFPHLKQFDYQPQLLNLTLKQVDNQADLIHFHELASQSFGYPAEEGIRYFHALTASQFKMENLYLFLIMLDEQAVGTILLATHDNMAGLYWLSVQPDYRNKGVASEAILAYLQFVRDLGFDEVVVQNMAPSVKLCQRIGFKPVGEVPLYVRTYL